MMIAEGFTCQRYGFNVGADKFSLLTIENGKNKHYAPIGMDIDFPKPKISLRQAARWKWTVMLMKIVMGGRQAVISASSSDPST